MNEKEAIDMAETIAEGHARRGNALVDLVMAVDHGMETVARALPAIGDGGVTLPEEVGTGRASLDENVRAEVPTDIESLYERWTRKQEEFFLTAARLHGLRRKHASDDHSTNHGYRVELDEGIAELRERRTALAALAKELRHRIAREIDGIPDGMVCPNCGTHDPFPPTTSDDGTTTCPSCGHRFPVSDAAARRARERIRLAAELSHPGG